LLQVRQRLDPWIPATKPRETGDDSQQHRASAEGEKGENPVVRADSPKKTLPKLPVNDDVSRLAKKLVDGLAAGNQSRNEIAREFTDGNATKADALLRQLRRFPALMSVVDKADPNRQN
jgi:hypothetical protein